MAPYWLDLVIRAWIIDIFDRESADGLADDNGAHISLRRCGETTFTTSPGSTRRTAVYMTHVRFVVVGATYLVSFTCRLNMAIFAPLWRRKRSRSGSSGNTGQFLLSRTRDVPLNTLPIPLTSRGPGEGVTVIDVTPAVEEHAAQESKSGTSASGCTCPDNRRLVVCLDGTANQFGINVRELCT